MDLKEALKRACIVLMSEVVARHCVTHIINGEVQVPNRMRMSRFRLSFDCGWMCVMRMLNSIYQAGGFAASMDWQSVPCGVMRADSSEQHGEDWLVMAYLLVEAKDIVPLSDALDALHIFFRR